MHASLRHNPEDQSAWVVFSGQADLPWLRVLKQGFRHCYVLMHDGKAWFSVDPMLNYTDVRIHHTVPAEFDFPAWLVAQGNIVVASKIDRSALRPAPWRIMSCVESVKRILGLHGCFIFTPWQLYRCLTQEETSKKSTLTKNKSTKTKEKHHG